MPTFVSGCWGVATRVMGVTFVYLSVRNWPGAGWGWGGERGGASCAVQGTNLLLVTSYCN
jgi:hypothetical protein